MAIDLEVIVERGYLYSREQKEWSEEEHAIIVERLLHNTLSEDFIWNYIDVLGGEELLNFMLMAYREWFLVHLAEEKRPKSLYYKIHLFRRGINSAVDYGADKALVREWLTLYIRHQTGDFITKKQRLKFITSIEEALDEELLQQRATEVLEKIAAKKTYKYTNKDLEQLLVAAGLGSLDKILINDKKTKECWLVNSRGELLYFDGKEFGEDPFQFQADLSIHDLQTLLLEVGAPCSEHLFFWSGKKTIHLLKRYGNIVVIYFSQYYSDRGEALFTEIIHCQLTLEEQMATLIGAIKNYAAHSSDYFDKRVGLLLPVYNNKYYKGFSRYEQHFVTVSEDNKGMETFNTFSSPEEATLAFEIAEWKLIQEGHYLRKINTFNNIEAIH